jgi:enterochelin esterase family protein
MIKKPFTRSLLVWAILCLPAFAVGQVPRGPFFISPQVNPDKTVIFRYLAPSAKEVKLSAQFEKNSVAMTKDVSGIWKI